MYEYKVKITRVVDGDTVDAELDLGFDIIYRDRIRLMGIDTPESRTRNKREKSLGLESKARLKELCSIHKGNILLKTAKEGKGKFGRILGEIWCFDTNINEKMIEEHHAVRYMGQSKEDIAEEHIKNRAHVNL